MYSRIQNLSIFCALHRWDSAKDHFLKISWKWVFSQSIISLSLSWWASHVSIHIQSIWVTGAGLLSCFDFIRTAQLKRLPVSSSGNLGWLAFELNIDDIITWQTYLNGRRTDQPQMICWTERGRAREFCKLSVHYTMVSHQSYWFNALWPKTKYIYIYVLWRKKLLCWSNDRLASNDLNWTERGGEGERTSRPHRHHHPRTITL